MERTEDKVLTLGKRPFLCEEDFFPSDKKLRITIDADTRSSPQKLDAPSAPSPFESLPAEIFEKIFLEMYIHNPLVLFVCRDWYRAKEMIIRRRDGDNKNVFLTRIFALAEPLCIYEMYCKHGSRVFHHLPFYIDFYFLSLEMGKRHDLASFNLMMAVNYKRVDFHVTYTQFIKGWGLSMSDHPRTRLCLESFPFLGVEYQLAMVTLLVPSRNLERAVLMVKEFIEKCDFDKELDDRRVATFSSLLLRCGFARRLSIFPWEYNLDMCDGSGAVLADVLWDVLEWNPVDKWIEGVPEANQDAVKQWIAYLDQQKGYLQPSTPRLEEDLLELFLSGSFDNVPIWKFPNPDVVVPHLPNPRWINNRLDLVGTMYGLRTLRNNIDHFDPFHNSILILFRFLFIRLSGAGRFGFNLYQFRGTSLPLAAIFNVIVTRYPEFWDHFLYDEYETDYFPQTERPVHVPQVERPLHFDMAFKAGNLKCFLDAFSKSTCNNAFPIGFIARDLSLLHMKNLVDANFTNYILRRKVLHALYDHLPPDIFVKFVNSLEPLTFLDQSFLVENLFAFPREIRKRFILLKDREL